MSYPNIDKRHVRLVTERTVEHFLLRLFLRAAPIRTLCIISPFINALRESRFTLVDLSEKIRREQIPTFIVTRESAEDWQMEAIEILSRNAWVEIRYNASVHAKVFIASAHVPTESFALFGSGNLTGRSIASNVEVGMLICAQGAGRLLVDELHFWAHQRLRILAESRLHQPMRRSI